MSAIDLPDPRPTLADVARAAGVSSATASRVLNGFPRVKPEIRREVQRAMAELGYVRQRAARTSTLERTGSVAVIVCEQEFRVFSDPFFGRVLRGAGRELTRAGVQLVLLMAQSARDYETNALRFLRRGHVDGALFVSVHDRYLIDPERIGVPVVSAGRPLSASPDSCSYVDADNRGGAERAVRYLYESGRTTVATVAGPRDMPPGVDRLAGYRAAVARAGCDDPGLVAHGDFGQASGEHAALVLLDRRPGIDAIFAASDLMAVGVLRALRRTGRRVPDDVAVIGFDDSPIARQIDPPLTTVRQPVETMGARAARELLELIDDRSRDPRQVVLDTELVVRESA